MTRRGQLWGGVWLVLAGFISAPAWAETAEALLGRMMTSARQLDYEGVFVYQRGDSIHTMRVVHRGSGPTEQEKLVSLTGPVREVIRDGSKVICKFADRDAVLVEEQQPRNPMNFNIAGPLEMLAALYRLEIEGGDRVAGRATQVVHVAPVTPDRYGYRLWIDEETGLLLKSTVLDNEQRSLEQEQFADVTVGISLPDDRFHSELSDDHQVHYTHEANAIGAAQKGAAGLTQDWIVSWLPAGFEQHHDQSRATGASQQPVRHFVYSDGLATVSVFIEKLRKDMAPMHGYSLVGAVNAFSWVAHEHQVTVVGEVPKATVRRIAGSVAPQTTE